MKKKILQIFGTRPEVIKMAPVYFELKNASTDFEVRNLVTAQHRDMLDQSLAIFGIEPEYDLDIMTENQDLFDVSIKALAGIKSVLDEYQPDCVLVQGDTTTTFIGSLAAYYKKITVGHIEAGLRTHNKYSPFPEEINRKLTGSIADLHFAPTQVSYDNLINENVSANDVFIMGNTSIDSLHWVLEHHNANFERILDATVLEAIQGRYILVTMHRRESFGKPIQEAFKALRELAERFPEVAIIYPVHPNPNVREQVNALLADTKNIHLIEPQNYVNFAHLMKGAELIVTDSGGVQEEGPSLSKPILVLRETTERQEGVTAGTAKLVGTDREKIVNEASKLLTDTNIYREMAAQENPYGDGKASQRIVGILKQRL